LTLVKGGQEDDVAYYVDGTYNDDGASGNASGDQTYPLSKLTASGPPTLLRRITAVSDMLPSQLHYVVIDIDSSTNQMEWLVYPQNTSTIEYFRAASPTAAITEETASGQVNPSVGSTNANTNASGPFDASAVKAADPDSLFRATNFARALTVARSEVGAHAALTDATLYPGYLVLSVVKGAQTDELEITAQDTYTLTNAGPSSGQPTFRLSQLPANGPETLAGRIARYGGTPIAHLHYMVIGIEPTSNQLQWNVYTVPGSRVEYFQSASPTSLIHGYIGG
jgi:hypothetical protein